MSVAFAASVSLPAAASKAALSESTNQASQAGPGDRAECERQLGVALDDGPTLAAHRDRGHLRDGLDLLLLLEVLHAVVRRFRVERALAVARVHGGDDQVGGQFSQGLQVDLAVAGAQDLHVAEVGPGEAGIGLDVDPGEDTGRLHPVAHQRQGLIGEGDDALRLGGQRDRIAGVVGVGPAAGRCRASGRGGRAGARAAAGCEGQHGQQCEHQGAHVLGWKHATKASLS